jgi:spore germination cell wall hydrolase CwlJ-like protein
MHIVTRVAYMAAPFLCLLGAATISAPSSASETPDAPVASATSLLAAVTGPLIADKVQTLDTSKPNFSTSGAADGSATMPTLDGGAPTPGVAESLPDLVADHSSDEMSDDETRCLASTVYFESQGEPLAGQLAVAQTILNRTHSGRFPSSVCGVVRQPGQFSFLRGGEIPTPPHGRPAWQTAVAIAVIARDGLWKQVAPDALYFHASRVSPGWGRPRVAALGHHIFFR